MKRLLFSGLLAVIVFFFVGIINLDEEFQEDCHLFVKLPPTYEWYFGCPPYALAEAENQVQAAVVLEYERVLRSYMVLGVTGEMIAFGLVELLFASLVIKPVFSKRPKFILLDLLFFTTATVVLFLCSNAWSIISDFAAIKCVLVVLLANFILFRVFRPVKKYRSW